MLSAVAVAVSELVPGVAGELVHGVAVPEVVPGVERELVPCVAAVRGVVSGFASVLDSGSSVVLVGRQYCLLYFPMK